MSFAQNDRPAPAYFRGSSKPYVRWWWLAGPFCERDIETQLSWVKQMGFGGVEPGFGQVGSPGLIPISFPAGSAPNGRDSSRTPNVMRIASASAATSRSEAAGLSAGQALRRIARLKRSVELPLSSFVLLGRRHFIATCSSSIISTGRHCTHTSRR